MSSYLVIRLLPENPVTPDVFTSYLTGLTITAYDSSFGIPFPDSTSPSLGSATYKVAAGWTGPNTSPPDFTGSSIAQHLSTQWVGLDLFYSYTSVATAVIVLPDYPEAGEYIRADPYLIISRGGVAIADPQIYYNVALIPGQPSTVPPPNPLTFQSLTLTSINLTLPPPGTQSGNDDLLPANGNAPNYDTLLAAVQTCMNADPGSLADIASLTMDESTHIANELLWDEENDPIPLPPNGDSLDSLYTGPISAGSSQDNDRREFEGDLQTYYVTLNAKAQKLAEYVFSLSTALACEALTENATQSGFYFPVEPGVAGTETAKVILSGTGSPAVALAPAFSVPAKFFYALTNMLPHQIVASQRFTMATMDSGSQVIDTINQAISDSVINKAAGDLTPDQVSRRLTALGLTAETGTPVYVPTPGSAAQTLVTDWLNFTAPDIDNFWAALPNPVADTAGQLALLLCVVTDNFQPLITAIMAPAFGVADAAQLAAKTDLDWENLFLPPTGNPALLPPFTMPGTPAERVQAFIRNLETYFVVGVATAPPVTPTVDEQPGLFRSPGNPIDALLALYPTFTFSAWDPATLAAALNTIFPGDAAAQTQFTAWLTCIQGAIALTAGIAPAELQFSVIEALWSAGFISDASINELSEADFTTALSGTVAYQFASTIWTNAGAIGPNPPTGPTGFHPINACGALVDCIPPAQLSPLGPVAYLFDLLQLASESTCATPFPTGVTDTLATVLATRRGPLGNLLATRSNLEVPIPLIDIVNESLEFMTATAADAGTVYNNINGTAPEVLFEVLPEHATPATLTDQQGAYTILKNDFSACVLPYSQPLDVSRTYLRQLGTSRYDTMRHFRKDITEFVLDPGAAPAGFQNWLWRYPVDINTAIEYLCITPEEYAGLFQPQSSVSVGTLYGGSIEGEIVLSEFLKYTCLSYCDFIALWKSGFMTFGLRDNADFVFPDCEPCCLDKYVLGFPGQGDQRLPAKALGQLTIFIRLWRKLNDCACGKDDRCGNESHCRHYTFAELSDICTVLQLFQGGTVNPDFIRQLAAFQMLRDDFQLPLNSPYPPAAGATGAARTQLLALWSPTAPAGLFDWAIDELLDRMYDYASMHHACERRREPEFLKLLKANLDPLSDLAGFNDQVSTDTWQAAPTHTLRFAEVLAKIYASPFDIGEILFLFTTQAHPDGDDAFPLQTDNDAEDRPMGLPEDDERFSLWTLRRQLLDIRPDEERDRQWNWDKISAAMQERFGYTPSAGGDALLALGQHFFPGILGQETFHPVTPTERRYTTPLSAADTSAAMWNNPPQGPFHFDATGGQLWTEIPLSDASVIHKLNNIRQLSATEQTAVQELYFQPRQTLAPFAFLFPDFTEAEYRLIQESAEDKRWAYFQTQFALAYERSEAIARHLALHVKAATGPDDQEPEGGRRRDEHGRDGDRDARERDGDRDARERDDHHDAPDTAAVHVLLKHLWADENSALTPWENDNGLTPAVTWTPLPTGGSYAALLGLVGTGLQGAYKGQDAVLCWQEMRSRTEAFGRQDDEGHCQIPTILPSMGLVFTPEQLKYAMVRNGFATSDKDGAKLGGAEAFSVSWKGVLIIDEEGEYCFSAGNPTPEGEDPDFWKIAKFHHWEVKLQRGQKKWVLLNHHWESPAPDQDSGPVFLKKGAYRLTIELERKPFGFSFREEVCPQSSGFQVKYQGPDTQGCKKTISADKLYTEDKNGTLAAPITFPTGPNGQPLGGTAELFLETFYSSSLRDMRRTYQRVYKSLLFTHRFELAGHTGHHHPGSEIGYMLSQPMLFAGHSYYRNAGVFTTHLAGFDFNFLPVADNYNSPTAVQDDRTSPSLQRTQAMFDWWERVFDYTVMRRQAHHSPEHPLWMLFYDAGQQSPDLASDLVRYMGIDTRHDDLVLQYFDATAASDLFQPGFTELQDDRWAVRVWHSERWTRRLRRNFYDKDITQALPYTWVADDPTVPTAATLKPGNQNLTQFYRDGCIDNGEPRRYKEIKTLNDGLRERGRSALIAYLTHMDRVSLPWGGFACNARQLSELLLLDVETGLCEKASRIDEAITAIQLFVMRARLGLEAGFVITPAFQKLWDRDFADFRVWEAWTRKHIYKENWVECEILDKEQHTKGFQFLASQLRSASLTIPVPGGLAWWEGPRPPAHPGIELLQYRNQSTLQLTTPAFEEGTDLMGTPDYHARPAWLAPFLNPGGTSTVPTHPSNPAQPGHPSNPAQPGQPSNPAQPSQPSNPAQPAQPSDPAQPAQPAQPRELAIGGTNLPTGVDTANLPMWFQAAVRLGTQFVRVAAAGIPPASTSFEPKCGHTGDCCSHCGKKHPAMIDEYYFWLENSQYYIEPTQVAEQGATTNDPTVDWDRPQQLPGLLAWSSDLMVHLRWCRVHNGQFEQPNQSYDGVEIAIPSPGDPWPVPGLVFLGRSGDSLNFSVTNGVAPAGYPTTPSPDDPAPGFRYDLATDEAIVLPLVVTPPAPPTIGGLTAFPFFGWFDPGAPVIPLSMYGTAIMVAGHLRAHCHFEAALKWYELIYNPLLNDNRWHVCDEATTEPGNGTTNPTAPADVVEQPTGDCCCASAPVSHAQVKNRAILMLYLETLLQWGDWLMREKRSEAFQQARLVFDTFAKITGCTPVTIFGKTNDTQAPTVANFTPACAPVNPRLMCLYMKNKDRLELIHHCMDLRRFKNGKLGKDMLYFGDSQVRDCWKLGNDACCSEDDGCIPQSPYRFMVLIQKAMEAASDLRSMGGSLLSAYEKGDVEYLSNIRAEQERQLANLNMEVSQNQWREADWQLQALQKTKEISQTRLQYYNNLIAVGLTPGEAQYEPLTVASTTLRTAGNVSVAIGQVMNIVPDPFVGFPSNFVKLPVGTKLSMIFNAAGTIANSAADILNTIASLGLTKDGWARRLTEWKYEVSVLTIEIEQIARQILAAERRKAIALRQLNNQQQQIENNNEIHNFIRDKFTGHALYLWLQQETAAMHYQLFELTRQYAHQAQRAFNFERGHTAREFLPAKVWDNLHEGLLCGERLDLSLKQMEKAYYDENRREYEITKHLSARLNFPKAFLQLQKTGYCEIDIPEWMFDQDYPGQYMRRIKNVTMTLPCVAGPYTGIHCRLTLLSSNTRIKPELLKPVHLCCDDHRCNNGYEPLPEDPRFVHLYAATEGIATSGGMNESGTFEVNFRDERYLPFEFQGAVSRWRIELPIEQNYFNLDTLSDLILHLNYTAREGGENLRAAAAECARENLPGGGLRFFDVRRELSDAWQQFTSGRFDGGPGCDRLKKLGLRFSRNMFPYLPGDRKIAVGGVEILFAAPCADPSTHHVLEFMVGKRHDEVPEGGCDCDVRPVVCVADEKWPGMFHGVLQLDPTELSGWQWLDLGVFRFPKDLREVGDVYLFCHYQGTDLKHCVCQPH